MQHHAALPADGYVRERQLVGNKKSNPPIPGIIPIGHATLWVWIKAGRFPAPVKIGPRVTAWRVEDVRAWLSSGGDYRAPDKQQPAAA